jgi:hypothetical protein
MITPRRIVSPNSAPTMIHVPSMCAFWFSITPRSIWRARWRFSPTRRAKAAAHLVLDVDGALYECVPCWEGEALRGWHAGVSRWHDGATQWEALNDWSIGIEIVNYNGNIIPFTDAQYTALEEIVGHLRRDYPALDRADAVLGHEQIAGFPRQGRPWLAVRLAALLCAVLSRPAGAAADAGLPARAARRTGAPG